MIPYHFLTLGMVYEIHANFKKNTRRDSFMLGNFCNCNHFHEVRNRSTDSVGGRGWVDGAEGGGTQSSLKYLGFISTSNSESYRAIYTTFSLLATYIKNTSWII